MTAIILGLTGSLHCVGMCSPLVVAVSNLRGPQLLNRLLYNSGRILTYALLGACISAFGSLAGFSAYQQALSLIMAAICIVFGLTGFVHFRLPLLTPAMVRFTGLLKYHFSGVLSSPAWYSIFFLGMLNGLLPCGLTSLALTNCIMMPEAGKGFIFMIYFGAGTLPVMFGFSELVSRLMGRYHFRPVKLLRVGMLVLGVVFFFRSFMGHDHPMKEVSGDGVVECRQD